MKRFLLLCSVGLCLAALQIPALAAEKLDCSVRPSWCHPGFDCLPTECAAESAAQLGLLTTMLENSRKTQPRRFHADLTCGPGIAAVVTDSYQMAFPFTPAGCVVGLAFRIGK